MNLKYAVFYSNDLNKVSSFYQNLLGFKKIYEDEKFLTFDIGGTYLGIKFSEKVREIPGHQTIIVEVEDVDSIYASLKKSNLVFAKKISDEGWGRNFSVFDTDLNKVEFFQH